MGTEKISINPRLQNIREDLKVQITDVYPSPGTILIVHPKNENVTFHPDFAIWLADTLKELLPDGVKGMVLSEKVANFDIIAPNNKNIDYQQGWHDALKAIVDIQ